MSNYSDTGSNWASRPVTDYEVSEAMIKHGGSFVVMLGKACQVADSQNLSKIKATWPEYWHQYTRFAQTEKQFNRGGSL